MKLCSIASGSSGNCIFAGSETTSLLIDAGISGKRVEAGLAVLDRSAKELDGILVTHEHSDHIQGLGVLARRYGIPIYATDGTIQAMQQTKSLGKFPEGIFHTIHADDTFTLGDIAVHPFTISHDAAEPVGYRMESGGKSIAIATDLGVYSDYTVHTAGSHGCNTVDDFSRNTDSSCFCQEVLTKDIEGDTQTTGSRTGDTSQDVDHQGDVEQRHALADTEEGISDFQEARQGRNYVAVTNFRCRVHDCQQGT